MKKISKVSITISLLAIILALFIQYKLISNYELTSGKAQGLYFLKHMAYFDYVFIGISSFILGIISAFYKEKLSIVTLLIVLSLLSIALLITPIWKYFI